MLNTIEFSKISKRKLPEKWKSDTALDRLSEFLQANWEQRSIFYTDRDSTSRQQFIEFYKHSIKTRNYIGTISFEGETLNIFPKVFVDEEEDDEEQAHEWNFDDLLKNLVQWLSYSDKLNFPFLSTESELATTDNLLELFITVYVRYLRDAIESQPFFQYEEHIQESSTIKGRVNFKDYITNKIPRGNHHKVQYTYSNFTFNNQVNIIIKSACKVVYQLTKNEINKDIVKKILMKMNEVDDKNSMPHDCDLIHLSKLHSKYIVILSMSKMFLLNRTSAYDVGRNQSFCFLFPTEVLFEGFVGGFLKETLTNVSRVATQTSSTFLANLLIDGVSKGQVFNLKEDILIENEDMIFVLDTKYKIIDRLENIESNKKLGISEQDMRQIALYSIMRNAKKVALIYPLSKNEEASNLNVVYDVALPDGRSHPIQILKIPFLLHDNPERNKQIIKDLVMKVLV